MAAIARLVRRLRRALGGAPKTYRGLTEVADARRIANGERALGDEPAGCAWLDTQTIDDLDMDLVFRAVDRTTTPVGAQVLWRWLVAPATERSVLDARERAITLCGDSALRDRIAEGMPGTAEVDAPVLPRLLWQTSAPPPASPFALVLILALVACLVFAGSSPAAVFGAVVFGITAIVVDTITQRKLAEQAYAIVILAETLQSAARLAFDSSFPPELVGDGRAVVAVRSSLRRRVLWLTVNDPFGLFELLRSIFLVRLFAVRSCMRVIEAKKAELRRAVLWLGELDAVAAIAELRSRRADAQVPTFIDDNTPIEAHEIVHPVLEHAIGNDLTLRAGLLITGSNASGKSTFLRTIGVNAILAQSIHTTFGSWQAPLVRVRTAMRINDDLGRGLSTYAAEVESVGHLVKAADEPERRATLRTLALLDEPFHGTNPAVRVPIVVAVLEHLAAHALVVAATHDLDVARQVSDEFARGYFTDSSSGEYDRKLHDGIAPSTNAVELLVRAGYPNDVLQRLRQG